MDFVSFNSVWFELLLPLCLQDRNRNGTLEVSPGMIAFPFVILPQSCAKDISVDDTYTQTLSRSQGQFLANTTEEPNFIGKETVYDVIVL